MNLTKPNKPLAVRKARAMVHVKGVPTVFYPTIHINPYKAHGQLLRYDKEDGQSDEETNLMNDNPTSVPVYAMPLLNHAPLLSRHDLARTYDVAVTQTRMPSRTRKQETDSMFPWR